MAAKKSEAKTTGPQSVPSMLGVTAELDEKAGTITMVFPIEPELPVSPSGKTNRVFSSAGNKPLPIEIDGRVVVAGVNLYLKR